VTTHRRHLDVGGWSTSAPRGLVEGDVSTISPSGWSCTRARRQGRRAEAAASAADRRADSASAPRGLVEGVVDTITVGLGLCTRARRAGPGVQVCSSCSSGQTGMVRRPEPWQSPRVVRGRVEGRFHLEVWRSSAADWKKTLTE
jgi:hypothetical protein